jgi:hypothetical protein
MSLGQENENETPELLEWVRSPIGVETIVFTDQNMKAAPDYIVRNKIGLLIEPRALRPWHYEAAESLRDEFKAILTFDAAMVDGKKFLFYPFGGSYIRDWDVFDKSRSVSMITSHKAITEGHRLRHSVAMMFGDELDVFGQPRRRPFKSKAEALRTYRFSVVIESERRDWYFTEKLIDCLSQGTVPIYWGCPDIGQFFNERGFLLFSSIEELGWVLRQLTEDIYLGRMAAILENLEKAKAYRVAEDWIVKAYPGLLGP